MKKKLLILLPCYNPTKNWEKKVIENYSEIENSLEAYTIFLTVVNDGSNQVIDEQTIKSLEQNITNFNYLSYLPNKGKGYAIRYGINNSIDADYFIYTDLDFPYTNNSLLKLAKALLNSEADVIAGIKSETYYSQVPFFRRFISKTLRFMIKASLQLPISDTQCGLKGFNKKGKSIFLKTEIERFLFDLEFLRLASRNDNIKLVAQEVNLKEGVSFTKFNSKVIVNELGNFFKVLRS